MRTASLVCIIGCAIAGAPVEAEAFWQRSQVSNCADAATEAELLRWRCSELGAYADPGWPDFRQFYLGRGAFDQRNHRKPVSGGVARRLG